MSDQSIRGNNFRYTSTENVQNSDAFNMMKDIRRNIFDKYDTDKNGSLNKTEAENIIIPNDDNSNLKLLNVKDWSASNDISDDEYNEFDQDHSGDLSPDELANGCIYLDSLDGTKDGIINRDSFTNYSSDGLKQTYTNTVQPWRQNYDKVTQDKLNQGIDILKNNIDCLPSDKQAGILSTIDNLQNSQSIRFNDNSIGDKILEGFYTNTTGTDNTVEIRDYNGDESTNSAQYIFPKARTDSTVVSANKEFLYSASPEMIAGTLGHELTHYTQFENKPAEEQLPSLNSEAEAMISKYEFLENLEAKGVHSNPTDNTYKGEYYNKYKQYDKESDGMAVNLKQDYLMNKIKEDIKPFYPTLS